LRTDDILCIRTGAMLSPAVVGQAEAGYLPYSNLLRLRIRDPDTVDPGYLLAYLSQPAIRARTRDRAITSVTTSLSTRTAGDLEIPVPPLDEQRQILAALNMLDQQTADYERLLNAAQQVRTTLGHHLTHGTVVLSGKEAR
jgi:type I restriction enzyme M protein